MLSCGLLFGSLGYGGMEGILKGSICWVWVVGFCLWRKLKRDCCVGVGGWGVVGVGVVGVGIWLKKLELCWCGLGGI